MTENIIAVLRSKLVGLMYYSEYEYPVTVHIIDIIAEEAITSYIAAKITGASYDDIINISPEQFFSRFENYLSFNGPDELMNENARQFLNLYEFLKDNFYKIFVYRVEIPGEALVPVFIIAQTEEDKFISLETTAVET